MGNGDAVFPSLGQAIPGVLDTPPCESKVWPALCRQKGSEECISGISSGIPLGCLGLQVVLKC